MVTTDVQSSNSSNGGVVATDKTTTTTTMAKVVMPSKVVVVDEDDDADRLELEAALSAACTSMVDNNHGASHNDDNVQSSSKTMSTTSGNVVDTEGGSTNLPTANSMPKQVLYNVGGGTELFQALERCDWSKAFELTTQDSLMTWVKSTGTTNTTFGWAIWRRLPLHEAVRRQAPAWLLVKMLSLYPESAYQTTQFGELPLHLAVETGSTPEVLHLLLTSYMDGTLQKDNSGRTPLDVVQENDYPDPIVLESLTRATQNQRRLVQRYESQLETMKACHEEDVRRIHADHQQTLAKEYEKQRRLQHSVTEGQVLAGQMQKLGQDSKARADEKSIETNMWKSQVLELRDEIEQYKADKKKQEEMEANLRGQLDQRDDTIMELLNRIDILSTDLRNSLVFHRDVVIASMKAANEDIQKMMASQQALQGHLTGEVQGLEMLLEKRGIDIPPLPPQPQKEPPPPEVDTSAAITAASKAANKALEVSNAKQGYV